MCMLEFSEIMGTSMSQIESLTFLKKIQHLADIVQRGG